MSTDRPRVITVFGSANAPRGEPAYEEALQLGRAIAEQGWTLCNGGYGGTMEAGARGAIEAGGHTIGVTCAALGRDGGPNAYIRQEVPTFDLFQRVNTLMRLASGFVVLPGGTGTLLEIGVVWEFVNKGLLPRRPLVFLGGFWQPLVPVILREQPQALRPCLAEDVPAAIAALQP
jgi:uncharacterized protein (TIGR00730 family)